MGKKKRTVLTVLLLRIICVQKLDYILKTDFDLQYSIFLLSEIVHKYTKNSKLLIA